MYRILISHYECRKDPHAIYSFFTLILESFHHYFSKSKKTTLRKNKMSYLFTILENYRYQAYLTRKAIFCTVNSMMWCSSNTFLRIWHHLLYSFKIDLGNCCLCIHTNCPSNRFSLWAYFTFFTWFQIHRIWYTPLLHINSGNSWFCMGNGILHILSFLTI